MKDNLIFSKEYDNLEANIKYNNAFAHRFSLANFYTTTDILETIDRSWNAYNSFALIAKWANFMTDFCNRDLQVIKGNERYRNKFIDLLKKIEIPYIVKQIWLQYWIAGNVIVYFGEEKPCQWIQFFDPKDVIIVWLAYNKPKIYLKPDMYLKKLNSSNFEDKILINNIPSDWLKKIKNNQYIELKEGTYTVICRNRLWNENLAMPYLKPILEDLEIYKTLKDADFAVAYSIKYWTRLIKIIRDKIHLPRDNNDSRSTADRAKDMIIQTFAKNPDRVQTIVIDDSIEEVKDLTLDPKVWNIDKYTEIRWNIIQHLDIPDVFLSSIGLQGTSNAYASAYISIKSLIQKLKSADVDLYYQFYKPLFEFNFGNKDCPIVRGDNSVFYDLNTLIQALNKLQEKGGLSLSSLGEPLGIEVLDEFNKIKQEQEISDISTDIEVKEKQGRPKKTEIPVIEETKQPRPSNKM